MKFTKKSKILATSTAILTLSAGSAITGTVAWFTANNIVNISGMNLQAETENGIVIAKEEATHNASSWGTEVEALHTGAGVKFLPTSTSDATQWFHGISKKADDGQNGVAYEEYAVTDATLNDANSVGTGSTATQVKVAKPIYLLNHFYIQASAKTSLEEQDLVVKSITATDSGNKVLNKALRVLFKLNGTTKIYCPLADGDFASKEHAGSATKLANNDRLLDEGTIPAYTDAGTNALDLSVYAYFEGEDANLKSSNIEQTLTGVSISFELENLVD